MAGEGVDERVFFDRFHDDGVFFVDRDAGGGPVVAAGEQDGAVDDHEFGVEQPEAVLVAELWAFYEADGDFLVAQTACGGAGFVLPGVDGQADFYAAGCGVDEGLLDFANAEGVLGDVDGFLCGVDKLNDTFGDDGVGGEVVFVGGCADVAKRFGQQDFEGAFVTEGVAFASVIEEEIFFFLVCVGWFVFATAGVENSQRQDENQDKK